MFKTIKKYLRLIFTHKSDPNEPDSTKERTKNQTFRINMFIIAVAILFVFFGYPYFAKKKPIEQKINKNPIAVNSDGKAVEHWIVEASANLKAFDEKMRKQEKQSNEYKKEVNDIKTLIEQQNKQMLDLKELVKQQQILNSNNLNEFRDQVENELQNRQVTTRLTERDVTTNGDGSEITHQSIEVQSEELSLLVPPEEKEEKIDSAKKVPNSYKGYLPVGAFFRATLLTGVTAPTGSAGEFNPVPVMLKVMTNAILPNDKYRYQLQGCFIMGVAHGSVSSERVKIKLSRISCLNKDGTSAVAAEIRGFVVDSDGITDLRGKFENRQGSKIAMASLAGFAEGIGKMFGYAQGTSVFTPAGSGISLDTSQKLKAAGFNGMSEAAETVSQFYVKQAQEIFPVIIVTTGRNITINITRGVTLTWGNIKDKEISEKEKSLNEEAKILNEEQTRGELV